MQETVVVYFFRNRDGTEQEFKTLSYDVAFTRALDTNAKVIARRYEYVQGKFVRNVPEAKRFENT